jgi:hypothetical protein
VSDQIEIKIEATDLTPESFLKAAESFLSIVQGVAKNITVVPIDWRVEVAEGSAILRVRVANPSPDSARSIEATYKGMRSLRSGTKTVPYGFTQKELKEAKTLVSIIDGTRVQTISFKNGGDAEDFPKSVMGIADALLVGETHSAFGSIEGKVDSLSDKHAFICSVYDPIFDREITCYFQKQEVEEDAYRAFRKRVLASGLIRYSKEGYPTSIIVDAIRVFPDESELPSIEEVRALFK